MCFCYLDCFVACHCVFCLLLFFLSIVFFFFFKQKTAYDMRISDWSSDVCSSDLCMLAMLSAETARRLVWARRPDSEAEKPAIMKIGRASCRERVCQYV